MKYKMKIVLLFFTLLSPFPVAAQVRNNIDISDNWKFQREDVAKAERRSFSDAEWQSIRLPHTWNNLDGV